jgi:hypothetical protein
MIKADMPFYVMEWEKTEDGLFASNRKTGELILLSRFDDSCRSGIDLMHLHRHSNTGVNTTTMHYPDVHTLYEQTKAL